MSHSAQKKKKGSNFSIATQIIPKMRNSNFSSFSKVNNIKDISHELPTMITPLDFIKQKKRFIIQDSFDIRGSKNFLKAKEEAMMEIKLDDEILEEIKAENKNKYNTNSSFVETKNDTKKFHRAKKRTYTISPVLRKKKSKYGRKSKHSHFAKNIVENKNREKNTNNIENIFINNNIDHDSKGSDYFYKFILENANETEDNFQKKFDKIIKDAENKQKNKNSKKSQYHSTLYENQKNLQKYNSAKVKRKKISIFDFSEQAKNLMRHEGLKESSILSESDNKKLSKRNTFDNIKFSHKNNNAFQKLEDKSIVNNSNKDSIFSILDLMG